MSKFTIPDDFIKVGNSLKDRVEVVPGCAVANFTLSMVVLPLQTSQPKSYAALRMSNGRLDWARKITTTAMCGYLFLRANTWFASSDFGVTVNLYLEDPTVFDKLMLSNSGLTIRKLIVAQKLFMKYRLAIVAFLLSVFQFNPKIAVDSVIGDDARVIPGRAAKIAMLHRMTLNIDKFDPLVIKAANALVEKIGKFLAPDLVNHVDIVLTMNMCEIAPDQDKSLILNVILPKLLAEAQLLERSDKSLILNAILPKLLAEARYLERAHADECTQMDNVDLFVSYINRESKFIDDMVDIRHAEIVDADSRLNGSSDVKLDKPVSAYDELNVYSYFDRDPNTHDIVHKTVTLSSLYVTVESNKIVDISNRASESEPVVDYINLRPNVTDATNAPNVTNVTNAPNVTNDGSSDNARKLKSLHRCYRTLNLYKAIPPTSTLAGVNEYLVSNFDEINSVTKDIYGLDHKRMFFPDAVINYVGSFRSREEAQAACSKTFRHDVTNLFIALSGVTQLWSPYRDLFLNTSMDLAGCKDALSIINNARNGHELFLKISAQKAATIKVSKRLIDEDVVQPAVSHMTYLGDRKFNMNEHLFRKKFDAVNAKDVDLEDMDKYPDCKNDAHPYTTLFIDMVSKDVTLRINSKIDDVLFKHQVKPEVDTPDSVNVITVHDLTGKLAVSRKKYLLNSNM